MLQPLHDGRIFGFVDVAEITPCFEIAKGVERHGRLSRRYRACSRTAWVRLRMPARWSATIVCSTGSNATSSPDKRVICWARMSFDDTTTATLFAVASL